jgi:GNAT superfamily N-acetyltransferase
MSITHRSYRTPQDYQAIDRFLAEHYQPGNRDGNWIEPAWEYMHGHPMLDRSALEKIHIWEDNGRIVAVVTYESRLGEAFFQFSPGAGYLREELFDYAEENLSGVAENDGRQYLYVYVNDDDNEFQSLVKSRGYTRHPDGDRPFASFEIPHPFPAITLPDGFRLLSLADEPDWVKVGRVLWRGFNHPGEPPSGETELVERQKMFDTPRASRDLKIAVTVPNGDFVSFCGMFYEPTQRFAYVEPVATDPDYRRLGLGKSAVLEGIRRCAALGATVAYVGSDQEFYRSMGFQVIRTSQCWLKYLI